jgi:membrane fusion protein
MTSDLFRTEALDYQSASSARFGKPTGVLPPQWTWVTLLLAGFMIALLVFLFTVDFARKETVRGKLRVDGAEARVYPLEAGLIRSVFVAEGSIVSVGQPIAEITNQRLMPNGSSLSEGLLAQLDFERESLERRRAAVGETLALNVRQAEQRLIDAKRKESEAKEQLSVAIRRTETARKRFNDAKGLYEKGIVAEALLNDRLEVLSDLERSVLILESQLSDALAAQSRSRLEAQQASAHSKSELAEIDQRLGQIEAQTQRVKAETAHIVISPIDGRVVSLSARAGEQTTPGAPLAIILPVESTLIAEAYLPSRAIGFVERGQLVKLQYDAFPYQKFGMAYGVINYVSNTAQLPQDLGVVTQSSESLYRISIRLDAQSIKVYSKNLPLQQGMEFTADIVLEDRRLVEWLLEPLQSGR